MALQSVATEAQPSAEVRGSKHSLWITTENVLTISIDRDCMEFPPEAPQCARLNEAIQGLARAAKSVIYQATNDPTIDEGFCLEPIDEIANAIILLSQLSSAVQHEISRTG